MTTDLKWDGDLVQDISGDVDLVDGREAFLQAKKLWFETPKDSLFYDLKYGTEIFQFLQVVRNMLNEMALSQVIKRELSQDPEIDPQTITVSVIFWNSEKWKVQVSFKRVSDDRPLKIEIEGTQNGLGVEYE